MKTKNICFALDFKRQKRYSQKSKGFGKDSEKPMTLALS
jgi:hypothetical protein